MSNAGDGEEEDEVCFYESLDRVLSSSSSTCSSLDAASDDESDLPNYASDHLPIPRFTMAVSNYDVWIAEPSSIEERRKRLLREMGLCADRSLSRLKSTLSSSDDHDHDNRESRARGREIARSVATDRCNSCTSSSSSSICSIQSVVETSPLVHNYLLPKSRSNGSKGSPTSNVSSSNKPPTGKPSQRAEEIRSDPTKINPSPNSNSSLPVLEIAAGEEFDDDSGCNGVVRVPDQFCTIRDLDNGKEFVVNEFREDGHWNKLREVGTGRHLTMEEFEVCVGHSPIVQELMRRQNVEELSGKKDDLDSNGNCSIDSECKSKKKGGWFKSIKNVASAVAGYRERWGDERDTSSEKAGGRSSSATDDCQDVSFYGPERVKVRQYGKPFKELTALYKSQEIQAHSGSIWTIKFSLDGQYLASAGEDCIIHVWQVGELERKGDLLMEKPEDGVLNPYFMSIVSPESTLLSSNMENHLEKKRRARASFSQKSMNLDHILVPETVFGLSEKPICSFRGHLDDVLDLSWSKSQIK